MKLRRSDKPLIPLRWLDIGLIALGLLAYLLYLTGSYWAPDVSSVGLVVVLFLLIIGGAGRLYLTYRPDGTVWLAGFRQYWPVLLLLGTVVAGGILRYQTIKTASLLPPSDAALNLGKAAVGVIANSDWQPPSYVTPPLYLFLSTIIVGWQFLQGANAGHIDSPAGVTPAQVAAGLGVLNLVLSLLTLLPVYLTASRLWRSQREGFIAAGLLATSWLTYRLTPEPAPALLAGLLAAFGFYFAVCGWQTRNSWFWWWAGLASGLAVAAAYGAALLLVPLVGLAVWAILIQQQSRKWLWLLVGGWLSGLTLGMPGWILSLNKFVTGVTSIGTAPSDAAQAYTKQAFTGDLGLVLGFGLALVLAFVTGNRFAKQLWLVLAFPLLYLLILPVIGPIDLARLALIIPFVALAATLPFGLICDWAQRYFDQHDDRHKWAGGSLAVALVVIVALVSMLGRKF